MKYIALPQDVCTRRLSFYLATEEFVARNINEDDCFFMWQVQPSVIFGRNQLIENEVNLGYCRRHGIQMYRRKSGGGCVYSDMNNVMFSYITKDENVNFTFNRYINMVVLVLHKMGVEATASGRNDILIDGRKVSGNAFYKIPGRSIVHGTMLYDTDMQNMTCSITPDGEKLLSKGINSIRQHIALLKDYTDMSLNEFKRVVRENLCDGEIMLTPDDVKCIEDIEQEYLSDSFIYGSNPKYTVTKKKRVEGVGMFDVRMELKNGIIKEVDVKGDFFLTGDIGATLLIPLRGVPLDRGNVSRVLPDRIDDIIMNMDKDDFVRLLTE